MRMGSNQIHQRSHYYEVTAVYFMLSAPGSSEAMAVLACVAVSCKPVQFYTGWLTLL